MPEFPFLEVTVHREQIAMVRRELLNDSTTVDQTSSVKDARTKGRRVARRLQVTISSQLCVFA